MIRLIFIVFILLFILYSMPICIEINYKQKNRKNQSDVYIIILSGLIRYKLDLTFPENKLINAKKKLNYHFIEKEDQNIMQNFNQFIHQFQKNYQILKGILKYFLDKIKIQKLYLNIEYSLENAALIGIISGILYFIESKIFISIFRYKNIKDCKIKNNPLFRQQNMIQIDFSCIIQFKLGHIINGSIKSLILYKRR
ncbi:DUF2953 domain-containing protein [Garciella nitratireducens]|uniref:DUF2953 domain-containing protein n=1 Tax=Garciella nitratireducens TaxID=218205 RepID=UPI000DE96072|nr:DUF2953 domain-containing protein [Garciella nitratireducens]RBP45581.1 hypothetical protein DFR81_102118 [Garciella nitratireducens]